MTTNDLEIYKGPPDIEDSPAWDEIVNELVVNLESTDAPDKVVDAAILMVTGWPLYKIAKKLSVKTSTVKNWLSKYPTVTKAVTLAKQNMTRWRMSQLEQQFADALNVSHEVLTVEPRVAIDEEGEVIVDKHNNPVIIWPNSKVLGVQAQHARYLISLFVGNKFDLNVNIRDETPLLKAQANAMEYLAKKIIDSRTDPRPQEETIIIVQDGKSEGPMLDENGEPNYGKLGEFDITEEGVQCHKCGKRFKQLGIHVRTKHKISNDSYETVYLLPPGSVAKAEYNDSTESNS